MEINYLVVPLGTILYCLIEQILSKTNFYYNFRVILQNLESLILIKILSQLLGIEATTAHKTPDGDLKQNFLLKKSIKKLNLLDFYMLIGYESKNLRHIVSI